MFLIAGLFMTLNSVFTHNLLSSYSNIYDRLSYTDKNETISRVNCSLYQFYILYMALTSTTYEEFSKTSYMFASFMFFDMIHYLIYVRRIADYIHHIVTILSVFYVNSYYVSSDTLALFNHLLILFESTNPPMSISWIGNKFGYKDYVFFKILGTFTFLNWTTIRIFYLSYYIYHMPVLYNQIVLMPFLALNLFWFKALINVFLKVIFKK